MGDQFEKFIIENRTSFNDETPSNSVWNSIDKRLAKKTSPFQGIWKVAAVLFLLSTVYLIIDKYTQRTEGPQLSQEFVQAEDYYTSLISQRKQMIKEQLSPEQEQQFLMEIDQLDMMYEELKNTYQMNASNERVVDAMINNLQLRLDILNKQLEILANINRQNNEIDSEITI